MPAARCIHLDRYNDGHCKICTRKRRNAWQRQHRAANRAALTAKRLHKRAELNALMDPTLPWAGLI